MAYQFVTNQTASFRFTKDSTTTDKTSLAGINATLSSADTICDGVSSLMAIGGYEPFYKGAERTVKESVNDDQA